MEPATQLLPFPKRPKVSTKFLSKPIKLVSNHFTLSLATKQPSIYLYDIKILETEKEELIQADARIQRQAIIKTALQKIREAFGTNFWHSGQLLWSLKNFNSPKTIETTQDSKHYAIVMTKTKEINLKPETFQDNKVAAQALQYLNILIKRYFMEKNFQEWGMNSKFYDPNQVNSIPDFFLEIYTGYKTSCQTYMNYTPKVLIDFASKIVRSDNVLYYIKEAKSNEEAKEMIRGRSVIASYGNFRMWRVDDIDYTSTPKKQIDVDQSGKKSTIADYYKNKYGLQIKDLAQPLLVSKDKKTGKVSLLVPELVQMTGLDDEMRKDFRLMTEVAKYTRLSPNQRMEQIRSLSAPLADYFSKQYGITMSQESTVEGNVLPTPKLTLGNKSFIPDRGNYQLRDPVFRPATFDKWIFVYSEACSQDASSFLETLENCAGAYAITLKKPVKVPIKDKSPEALKEAIRSRVKADTQIVVCMYPPIAKKYWYKALKDVCSKEIGVPCQAVISASLKKNGMSVCSKILLQMNAKVGLELWLTERPVGLPEKTMLIGADVYHNTKIGQERKSCVGFCASLNPEFNKFFSKVTFQNKIGQEIMTGIGALVKEAVLKYFAFNGKKFLPEYIVFFRDSVGENQLRAILDIETKAILTQLKTIDPNYNVKFAEIVVTKRIDDRIFSMDGGPKGGKGVFNPPAGTVVADTVVSNNFDYLLVSQNVTQGTCTPTHYNVIYDTTGLSQDMFWQLSYSQCYNYYNWNGSVRVPAPVQYAHKLAYLVGQTVQGEPEKKLDNKLYYL